MFCCASSLSKASLFPSQLSIYPDSNPLDPNSAISLAAMDIWVISLQFPQLVRFPFLGSLTMSPMDQCSGTLSFSHIVLNSSYRTFTVVSVSALRRSAVMLSVPGVLLLFIFSSVSSTSAITSGTFTKCFRHLALTSFSLANSLFLLCSSPSLPSFALRYRAS